MIANQILRRGIGVKCTRLQLTVPQHLWGSVIGAPSFAALTGSFWVTPQPWERAQSTSITEREREREVFIEKWGFTVPFLAKESLKDPASLSQISAQCSARGFELDQLSGDVEPRLQRAFQRSPDLHWTDRILDGG